MRSMFYSFLLLSLFWNSFFSYSDSNRYETVIVSSVNDPYYGLAEEISETEGISIYNDLESSVKINPVYLLWVVSPENLSEKALADFSTKLNGLDGCISIGIISGHTIEDARRLWKSRLGPRSTDPESVIINGSKFEPGIIYSDDGKHVISILSRENVLSALESAAIVQISLEGASGLWFDKEFDIAIKSHDIPNMNGSVIQNFGCSTFKPWKKDSIALECIRKGASIYAGFIYPTVTGTRFGDYKFHTLLYSWEKFPIGHLVQIQNKASMQSYANRSHFFMFGDPRMFCSQDMPYKIVSDKKDGERRIISLDNVRIGIIPVYIENGSEYEYVTISGKYSARMKSSYFNNKVQMIDINRDKYVAVFNENENLSIELRKKVPLLQGLFDDMIDFMDSSVVSDIGSKQSFFISLFFIVLFGYGIIKKRYRIKELIASLIFASIITSVFTIYIIIRIDSMRVTSIPLSINCFYLTGVFIYTCFGGLMYISSVSRKGRMIAVFITDLNTFLTLLFFIAFIFVKQVFGEDVYDIYKFDYPWMFTLQKMICWYISIWILLYLYNRISFVRKNESD